MKIEFGCGENPHKKEFMSCDIRDLSKDMHLHIICKKPKIDIKTFGY